MEKFVGWWKPMFVFGFVDFVALHPTSGVPGGVVAFFTSSMFPTILNFSISFYIAFKILTPPKTGLQIIKAILIMICISFLLGVNANAPLLFNTGSPGMITIGGHEGCMCMFFDLSDGKRAIIRELSDADFLYYYFLHLREYNIWNTLIFGVRARH